MTQPRRLQHLPHPSDAAGISGVPGSGRAALCVCSGNLAGIVPSHIEAAPQNLLSRGRQSLPVRAQPGPLWPPIRSHRQVPPRWLSRPGGPVPLSHPAGLIPGVRFPGALRPHSPERPSSARSSGRSGTERGPMSACGRSPGASAECGRRQRQETDSLRRRVRGGGNAAGGAGAGPAGPGGRGGWTPLPRRRRASVSLQRHAGAAPPEGRTGSVPGRGRVPGVDAPAAAQGLHE